MEVFKSSSLLRWPGHTPSQQLPLVRCGTLEEKQKVLVSRFANLTLWGKGWCLPGWAAGAPRPGLPPSLSGPGGEKTVTGRGSYMDPDTAPGWGFLRPVHG